MKQQSTEIEAISKYIESLQAVELLCRGVKISTLRKYRDYYFAVDAYIRQGATKTEAITWTADDFQVCESSVYRGLGFFSNRGG